MTFFPSGVERTAFVPTPPAALSGPCPCCPPAFFVTKQNRFPLSGPSRFQSGFGLRACLAKCLTSATPLRTARPCVACDVTLTAPPVSTANRASGKGVSSPVLPLTLQRIDTAIHSSGTAGSVLEPVPVMGDVSPEVVVQDLRKVFRSGATRDILWRQEQLRSLARGIAEMKVDIYEAIMKDLKRGEADSYAEAVPIRHSALDAAKNLEKWARATKVPTNFLNFPAQSEIAEEPYGVVLVIAPWNFPFTLALEPLIGTIAAGNVMVLKPSELAPHCAAVLRRLVEKYLDTTAIRVVEGGPEVGAALLREKWDKIFFTGGTEIGRKVAVAAAQHLTPVTLELGGKNPCYLDSSADLKVVCKRIAWGMCANAGQLCVRPEYILAEEKTAEQMLPILCQSLVEMYGEDPSLSPDIGRIINDRHLARLAALVDEPCVREKIVVGGMYDKETRFFAPTVIKDAPWDAKVMLEETFGPILVVQTVGSAKEAIAIINDRPKPLVLYVFTQNASVVEEFTKETSSGSLVVNETVAQLLNHNLPFGGVGDSGMGNYYGKASFDCFSHKKSILKKSTFGDVAMRYPPSTPFKKNIMLALLDMDIVGAILVLLGLRK